MGNKDADQEPSQETLLLQYQTLAAYEVSTGQLRFQTLAIYIAAVGLIVGRASQTDSVALLLIAMSIGMWILDLRGRHLSWKARETGKVVGKMLHAVPFFEDREPEKSINKSSFGLFNSKSHVNGWAAGLIAHQVGIDTVFFGVMGFGASVLAAHHWSVVEGRSWVVQALALIAPFALAQVIYLRQQKNAGEQGK